MHKKLPAQRFKEFLIDPNTFTESSTSLNRRTHEYTENYEDDKFCELCHDIAIYFLSTATAYYDEPEYKTEPNDIAWFAASLCWTRLNAEWRAPIRKWVGYIRFSMIRWREAFRCTFSPTFTEKFYQYNDDPQLDEIIKLSSGLLRQIPQPKLRSNLKSVNILKYVMVTKCKYLYTEPEYKYLAISLMISLTRGYPVLYKLNSFELNHLKYLINSYNIIINRYIKQGVIRGDT